MSAAEAQSEPTMEEILASIRKIISEDDVKPQEEASNDSDAFNDVLELQPSDVDTHVSADFDFDSLDIAEPAVASNNEDVSFDEVEDEVIAIDYEPEETPEPEPYFAVQPKPEPVAFEPPQAPPPIYQEPQYEPIGSRMPPQLAHTVGLIGADAANAASEQFAKLGTSLPNHFASGASVEELVAYLLKPMLKDWLDNNLPRIVEERVEAELARIARRGF